MQTIERQTNDPAEGRAVFAVLIRGRSPLEVSKRAGVPIRRIYELRRGFIDAFPLPF